MTRRSRNKKLRYFPLETREKVLILVKFDSCSTGKVTVRINYLLQQIPVQKQACKCARLTQKPSPSSKAFLHLVLIPPLFSCSCFCICAFSPPLPFAAIFQIMAGFCNLALKPRCNKWRVFFFFEYNLIENLFWMTHRNKAITAGIAFPQKIWMKKSCKGMHYKDKCKYKSLLFWHIETVP